MIRKVCIFHKTLVFSICSSGHKDVISAKIAENISGKVLEDFCSKSENQNKKLIFQRKSPEVFFWTRRLRFSSLPEIYQPNWKKIEYSSKLRFFSENSRRPRGSKCDNSTQCFCSKSKHGENLKTVSFS